jgi:hypothetical protein
VAAGEDAVDLYLFNGDDGSGAVSSARIRAGGPDLDCARRAAVVPGSPNPARFEIGPTGKPRGWMIHEHWQDSRQDREARPLPVG